jgi:hypothetical protein
VRRRGSHIFSRQSAHRWRWVCHPYLPAGRRFPVLVYVRGWIDPSAHGSVARIRSIDKFSDLIRNRTRDLPTCSTTLPRVPVTLVGPHIVTYCVVNWQDDICWAAVPRGHEACSSNSRLQNVSLISCLWIIRTLLFLLFWNMKCTETITASSRDILCIACEVLPHFSIGCSCSKYPFIMVVY